MICLHHGSAPAFRDMIIDNFDEMLRQSAKQSLVYGIALQAFIAGQPFRLCVCAAYAPSPPAT
jgi:allantoinase